jgi:hypothetical protein
MGSRGGSVIGNPEDCDRRHRGLAKTDIKPENLGISGSIDANNRLLLIFPLVWMSRLAT